MTTSSNKSLSDWVVSVQNLELMPDPHTESGSQDGFVIDAADSLVPLQDITALRYINISTCYINYMDEEFMRKIS